MLCHCEPVSQRWRGNPFSFIEIADPFTSPWTTVQGLISRTPVFCSIPPVCLLFLFSPLSPALFVQSIRFLRAGAAENLPMIHFFSLASFPDSW
jgi:hypothetical protein